MGRGRSTECLRGNRNDPVAEILRTYRNESGLTEREAAREMGLLSCRHIKRWEAGEQRPTNAQLARLADVYGMNIEERVALIEATGFRFTQTDRVRPEE